MPCQPEYSLSIGVPRGGGGEELLMLEGGGAFGGGEEVRVQSVDE